MRRIATLIILLSLGIAFYHCSKELTPEEKRAQTMSQIPPELKDFVKKCNAEARGKNEEVYVTMQYMYEPIAGKPVIDKKQFKAYYFLKKIDLIYDKGAFFEIEFKMLPISGYVDPKTIGGIHLDSVEYFPAIKKRFSPFLKDEVKDSAELDSIFMKWCPTSFKALK